MVIDALHAGWDDVANHLSIPVHPLGRPHALCLTPARTKWTIGGLVRVPRNTQVTYIYIIHFRRGHSKLICYNKKKRTKADAGQSVASRRAGT